MIIFLSFVIIFYFLINLYNQSRSIEKDYKRLPLFKTLYKQIGCGERNSLFFTLTHDKKIEAEKVRNEEKKEAFSVEEVFELANAAGKKYFIGENKDGIINTIPEFKNFLLNLNSFFEDLKQVFTN